MAAAFEKAVADKMGKGRANKQGQAGPFPKLTHRNQSKVHPRPFPKLGHGQKVKTMRGAAN